MQGSVTVRQRARFSLGKELGAFSGLLILCVILTLSSPYFLSVTNIMNVLRQSSLIAIVATG